MATEVIMPALSPAQETGILIEWFKEEGDLIEKGEPLMEVETDKANVEVEATTTGILANITVNLGDEIPVGKVIALILADGESAPESKKEYSSSETKVSEEDTAQLQTTISNPLDPSANLPTNKIVASPKVRQYAKKEGIDLSFIKGSGPNGVILMEDVLVNQSSTETEENDIPTSKGWRLMADRLTESWSSAPHFNLVRHLDVSNLVTYKKQVQEKNSNRLTYTDLLIKLVSITLKEHPRINASWIDNKIVKNSEINVGLAVDFDGGLIVPVIHKTDELSLGEITNRRKDLITRTQAGKLRSGDLDRGTFTISNLGMFDVDSFNAIINPPQAAILAVGRIVDKVVPVDGLPAVRPILTLNLSFDHRVVDGVRGAKFLKTLSNLIENPLQSG
ncbi:MAG: 2-oxo acid dehydrogenase subunit E2 [Gammaproteobacteria bacterium]|nr:2-oxo acid dehydrogenase subunit E2 [Candidatus Nitrosopelagicus sp.]MCS5545036.1 2-oxo acid dehydrogenase subunit E2 [Gammaproteobacteria bacterium]HIA33467.1 2-oxo acid dehydrogenase subunit E2 [Candidatus Lambdaproteobacteria bacterium]HIB39073.1 2-oxo acid dehydrogenase subunit E2 [Candidatus Lambdaproteobacteria bacterium]HIO46629.1 2-oxo acid dehydrogenase subunit E2 [Candidatus Poribacteria bacterium]